MDLVFGLVPTLQTTRREVQESLKEGARGSTGSRALVRNTLVVAQVSLALVALVGALLFVRSFRNLDTYELGFRTTSLMTLRFYMPGEVYEPKGAKLRRVEHERYGDLPLGAEGPRTASTCSAIRVPSLSVISTTATRAGRSRASPGSGTYCTLRRSRSTAASCMRALPSVTARR